MRTRGTRRGPVPPELDGFSYPFVPGDLYCHVVVETPVSLTERQRQLLREFDSISAQDSARHNPRAKG